MDLRRILFVCTGNMIRSPMGEFFLQKALSDRGIKNILCESAGTYAMDGNPAINTAVKLMAEYAINMQDHRSRGLTAEMLEEAELIICMEKNHLERCLAMAPHCAEKMTLLGDFIDNNSDKEIDDPIGGLIEDYEHARERIRIATTALADKLAEEYNDDQSNG